MPAIYYHKKPAARLARAHRGLEGVPPGQPHLHGRGPPRPCVDWKRLGPDGKPIIFRGAPRARGAFRAFARTESPPAPGMVGGDALARVLVTVGRGAVSCPRPAACRRPSRHGRRARRRSRPPRRRRSPACRRRTPRSPLPCGGGRSGTRTVGPACAASPIPLNRFSIGSKVAYPNGYCSSRGRCTSLDTYSVSRPTTAKISENRPSRNTAPDRLASKMTMLDQPKRHARHDRDDDRSLLDFLCRHENT